jgi:hypothetical protein
MSTRCRKTSRRRWTCRWVDGRTDFSVIEDAPWRMESTP